MWHLRCRATPYRMPTPWTSRPALDFAWGDVARTPPNSSARNDGARGWLGTADQSPDPFRV
jgi:hypothetical protein